MWVKLIIRNWKRNKIYSFTAIISLIIGLTCCNLLVAFVINEWQIAKGSPDIDRICVLQTDNPMTLKTTKERSSFIISKLPPLLKATLYTDYCSILSLPISNLHI